MPADDLVRAAVALGELTTLGVGGPAAWFVRATLPDDVAEAHRWCEARRAPLFVLGGGSNVVIADEGFDGCVLQMALRGKVFAADGDDILVTAAAGEPWDSLVADIVGRGLTGVECLSGIPGSVGGTPIQNVGAYGQEVSDTIEQVTVYDRTLASMHALRAAECAFSYRMSRFKAGDAGRFIVCDVTFRLRPGVPSPGYPDVVLALERAGIDTPRPADVREAVLAVRRRKGMVIDPADPDTRSVGSFFMNPVVTSAHRDRIASTTGQEVPGFVLEDGRLKIPAAWLIERAGFEKGDSDGAVGISTKHPLALVNRGGASARDVLRLAARIKRRVLGQFDVWLRPEPVFIGFGNTPALDFLLKATD